MTQCKLLCALILVAGGVGADEQPLSVLLLESTGTQGCQEALADCGDMKVAEVAKADEQELLAADVLAIGATAIADPKQVRAIRMFVWCGGGLVLHHNSCGRRQPETLFPEIVAKVPGREEDTVLVLAETEHPVVAGSPEQFEHAYYDHLVLEPGPKATVLVRDRGKNAVVVAGEYGHGRVVFCGNAAGYWSDPVDLRQAEKPPVGGELKLLENAVRWAGAGRVTGLSQEELAARRREIDNELVLKDARRLMPTSDWFAPEMLHGVYLPRRPVNELDGRFFITYDYFSWRRGRMKKTLSPEDKQFFRERMRIDLRRLKWLGVTDVAYWVDVHGARVAHATDVPDCQPEYRSIDPVMELVELAHEEGGLKVWVGWHSTGDEEVFKEKYAARDGDGNVYLYGGEDGCEDLLSTSYRERVHRLIDDYDRYTKHGNFEGILTYDEIFFCYADFHGDDVDKLTEFCMRNFGESPPDDIGDRLALGRKWTDPNDIWRRRYILFKNSVVTDFLNDYVAYAHSRGLKVGVELRPTAQYSSGWCWGMDNVALSRLGADYHVVASQRGPTEVYPNAVSWAHVGDTWGYYNTHCLLGGPGGACFTFNQLWKPILYANNPHYPRELARHIRNQREWANAERLVNAAVLHNQNALQMLFADPRERWTADQELYKAITRRQDADIIFVRATELFDEYRLLVAVPHEMRGLSQEVLDALRRFIEGGGVVVSLGAVWSTAQPDLTQERDVTEQFVGVSYGEPLAPGPAEFDVPDGVARLAAETPRRQVRLADATQTVASFRDGTPAVTERPLGNGKIIGVHFDAPAEIRQGNPLLADYLAALVEEAAHPAIRIQSSAARVISTLRKGDWALVALWSEEIPAQANVRIDTEALGIRGDRGFQVHMLAKEMEILPPGEMWGDGGFWTPAQLAEGLHVTIGANNDNVLPLPDTIDLSAFEPEHASYIDHLLGQWWDNPARGKRRRHYEHEILVIGPGDELHVADMRPAPERR